jgi:hypothetical protein
VKFLSFKPSTNKGCIMVENLLSYPYASLCPIMLFATTGRTVGDSPQEFSVPQKFSTSFAKKKKRKSKKERKKKKNERKEKRKKKIQMRERENKERGKRKTTELL